MEQEKIKELEQKINGSEIFFIKKEDKPDKYDTIWRKLLRDINNYTGSLLGSKNERYGYEIVITAYKCLGNYKKEHGPFLNYFIKSLFKTIRRNDTKENVEERRKGINVSDHDQRLVSRIYNYLRRECNIDPEGMTTENLLKYIAKYLKAHNVRMKPEDIVRLRNLFVQGEVSGLDDEGNAESIYDLKADVAPNAEEILLGEQLKERILIEFASLYNSSRDSSKARNRLIISYILFYELKNLSDLICEGKDKVFFEQFDFIDCRILDRYYAGEACTQKDLATLAEISEAAVAKAKMGLLIEFQKKFRNYNLH